MIKYRIVIILGMLVSGILGGSLSAQTFEEYKKQRQQEMQQFRQEREEQMKRLADEFDQYVRQQDEQFKAYLKERWRQFQVYQGVEPPEEPKPEVAPVYEPPARQQPPEVLPTMPPALEKPPVAVPEPILPRVTRQEPEKVPARSSEIDFYGFPVIFDYDQQMAEQLPAEVSEETISNYFAALSNTSYNRLLDQLYDYSGQMSLNDWGYYLLAKDVAKNIAGDDQNTRRLLTWFLLLRSGYKVKAAYYQNQVYVLIPVVNQVYAKNYFTFDNLNYYLMEGDLLNLYTYEQDFPGAQKIFDLNIHHAIALGDDGATKQYDFQYNGESHPVDITYNGNIINFYNDYPQADIKVYFDAVVSPEAKNSLANNFVPLIQELNEPDAVNLLLHFVQTAFDYKTDQDQFGYEKFFFAEELFYYPAADCEDRSVLFAYLVKSLLGLDVIGLNYTGHMSTAVHFNMLVNGDYVTWEGKKYIVADPTYINAPVGMTMPKYLEETARVIPIDNNYGLGREKDRIWNELLATGAQRGDNRNDLILTADGGSLVTGFYTDAFEYGDISVDGNGKPTAFIMKLDESLYPEWFHHSRGKGTAMAYSLTTNKKGTVWVSGSFSGEIAFNERILKSDRTDLFVNCYTREGELLWAERAHIDTANQDNYLNFVSRFGPEGRHQGNELFFETGDFNNYGISLTPEGEVVVAGAFNKTTGMNMRETAMNETGEFDIAEALKDENDRLIRENYEKTIAGLFAVVYLVQNSGMSIPGEQTQQVLDRYNPAFKKEFPDIYKTISSILFIKNQDGIVTIRTDNKKGVSIDMMRVDNDARVKVSMLESGDARIDVLSGVRVGKAFWWYDLNYIIMYRKDGNLLFDYDTDHAQQVRNLRDDILY